VAGTSVAEVVTHNLKRTVFTKFKEKENDTSVVVETDEKIMFPASICRSRQERRHHSRRERSHLGNHQAPVRSGVRRRDLAGADFALMAKFKYTKEGSLAVTFDNFFQKATDLLVKREDTILIALNEKILALTPVWEGDALINWRWSTRAPMSGHINPVESPEDPGHTNKMPLGAEPRRAANEARPRASLLAALAAPRNRRTSTSATIPITSSIWNTDFSPPLRPPA
jgi:hypothetical protein